MCYIDNDYRYFDYRVPALINECYSSSFLSIEFTSLHRSIASGEVIECQLKLATQKWKARCKIARHQQQFWQDNDVRMLGHQIQYFNCCVS